MIEIVIKLILAVLIGFLIGKERKRNEKPGGSRTMALVCLGSALIAILSLELLKVQFVNETVVRFNFARLMSYTIASMGFLGSGIIIQNKDKVEGLTTASTLFALVPIGFCLGLGFYTLALITSVLAYILLEIKYLFKGDH